MALEINAQDARSALLRYMDKNCPQAERERFDERFLNNEMFPQQVEEAEFLLMEQYSAGELPPSESALVAEWIASSPRLQAHAAVTNALRASSKLSVPQKRFKTSTVWLAGLAIAACVALLVSLPIFRKPPPASTPAVAELTRPPLGVPVPADTILLEARHLRGADTNQSQTYTLHPGAAIHLQVLVPQGAPRGGYSIDLAHTPATSTSVFTPAHINNLQTSGTAALPFVEFDLPPNSLPQGEYECFLHSTTSTYRLVFSVSYGK